MNTTDTLWNNDITAQLATVLASIADDVAMKAFLRDVLTEKEIVEISARLEAARMLRAGATYTDIIARTKLSSRTIARIKDWMQNGSGGYATVLAAFDASHGHTPPAGAA